jgi:hypothetical protein
MKRVNLQIHDFPNFVKYTHGTGNDAWEQDCYGSTDKTTYN